MYKAICLLGQKPHPPTPSEGKQSYAGVSAHGNNPTGLTGGLTQSIPCLPSTLGSNPHLISLWVFSFHESKFQKIQKNVQFFQIILQLEI